MFPDSNRTDSAADRIRFHFFMQFFLLLSFSFLMLPIIYEESAIRIPFRYRLTFCSLPSKWVQKKNTRLNVLLFTDILFPPLLFQIGLLFLFCHGRRSLFPTTFVVSVICTPVISLPRIQYRKIHH